MKQGDLVKDCSFYRDGRDDDHVGVIVKEHTYEYMTSDSVTEYHNVKCSYDVFWQNPSQLEEGVEEHDIELYETWLAEQKGKEILTAVEDELTAIYESQCNDK